MMCEKTKIDQEGCDPKELIIPFFVSVFAVSLR
jgi:hypothetical protein